MDTLICATLKAKVLSGQSQVLWNKQELQQLYAMPVLELVFLSAQVHRMHHDSTKVQVATLLSIKTGGCVEDCSYCGQAARYHTGIKVKALMSTQSVIEQARKAKETGSTRFCMAAAWREVRDNRDFDRVLEMVSGVNERGLEVCCTLGMLTPSQAERLAQAGLFAYNHNIDTSKAYYDSVITTRSFDQRLATLDNVRKAGISVCSGGIIGLGETIEDRIEMVLTLANMEQSPESVPINVLAAVQGTPLENSDKVDPWDIVRMVALSRITMPKSMVRLSAGRTDLSEQQQAFCFLGGANSIFTSATDTLLVTPNPSAQTDLAMLCRLGMMPLENK